MVLPLALWLPLMVAAVALQGPILVVDAGVACPTHCTCNATVREVICTRPVDAAAVIRAIPSDTQKLKFRCTTNLLSLPSTISSLKQLSSLTICGHLTSLPEEVGLLPKLLTLHVESNLLTSLPASLGKRGSLLRRLNLNLNKFTVVPPQVANMTRLQILRLNGNSIKELPSFLANLTALTTLEVSGNPLRCCDLGWLRSLRTTPVGGICNEPALQQGLTLSLNRTYPNCSAGGTFLMNWDYSTARASGNVFSLNVGDTMSWRWTSNLEVHNVRCDVNGGPNSPDAYNVGPFSFTWTATAVGTYPFYCNIHPDMKGTIYVGVNFTTTAAPTTSTVQSPWLQKWIQPLTRPSVLQGTNPMTITMTEVKIALHPDLPPTTLWTYNGEYPGPTIEAVRNQATTITFINDLRDTSDTSSNSSTKPLRQAHYLPVETCLHGPMEWGTLPRTVPHLHGGHLPARVDGHPDYAFAPGGNDTYTYPNNQAAATLWYHDHGMGITRLNVYMGLAGFYLLREPSVEAAFNLPSGDYEVPLVIQDRRFNMDGSLYYPGQFVHQVLGDVMLVNGRVWPFLRVRPTRYLFRILNGCNSRTLNLTLSDGAAFTVVAGDVGYLPRPVTVRSLLVGQAERYSIVIDFSGYATGARPQLLNVYPGEVGGAADLIPVLQLRVLAPSSSTPALQPIPSTFLTMPTMNLQDANSRRLQMRQEAVASCGGGSRWSVDGLGFHDITEYVFVGTEEIWEFDNPTSHAHPMHLHMAHFRVIDRRDRNTNALVSAAWAQEAGWKDTVLALPGQLTRVLVAFKDYNGRFVYHCHHLEHEDNEMMRQFQVIADFTLCNRNQVCDAGEDCYSCPDDCAISSGARCGNGLCEITDGETCQNCAADCAGSVGGSFCCGLTAGNATSCTDARCTTQGFHCTAMQQVPACCGDGVCEGGETLAACKRDCTK
eukprot:m.132106 g.132106  ORF g.132106 m.132106 type:complete len:939 (-) comp16478_c0_seq5:33-2849(-)